MSEYHPDRWVPVLIESEEHGKIYKILAGWYGGYTSGNSWKLSSGVESLTINGDTLEMPQSSGSVYYCHKNAEGMSGYMSSIFSGFEKQAVESEGRFTIKIIGSQELVAAFFE